MEWTRSNTLALASSSCSACHGLGQIIGKRGRASTCNCVLRAVFRACYQRFVSCAKKEKYITKVSLDFTRGTDRRFTWGRKNEEYMADFALIGKRTLTEDEHRIFRYHFLLGADWRLCARKFRMDRGTFFHTVYRIQRKLGRQYAELKPYSLYPLDEYFSDEVNGSEPVEIPRTGPAVKPVRVPLKQAA